jgi:hypothetical protein
MPAILRALNVVTPQTSAGLRAGRSSARRRLDGRSVAARHVKQLLLAYTARLGATIDPCVLADIRRLSELEALCASYRNAALRQEPIDPAILVRLEGRTQRLRKALNLDGPPPPPPPMTLDRYLALKQAEEAAAKAAKRKAKAT